MIYQPMPYPPPYDGAWSRSVAPIDDWGRPQKPWIDGYATRSARSRWDDPDFNPFDPRPYDMRRGWRENWGGSPGPFYDPPTTRGAGDGALNPADFGGAPGAAPIVDRGTGRIIEQLSHCAAALKRCGERLSRASSDAERRDAAIDGHAAIAYFYGLMAAEGVTPPPAIFGDSTPVRGDTTRGDGCREAGSYIERMIEKYTRGTRGAFTDIGEGIDKIGSCVREVRENLGR